MTSWQQPTADEISRVAYLTARPEEQQHFFTHLDNPLWINALYCAGHLTPVQPEGSEDERSYPPRPITQYIARVAGSHPDPAFIATVLFGLSETDNLLMQSDLMKAMRSLDPQFLTDLLPAVARWTSASSQLFFLADGLGDLVVHALHDSKNADSVRSILEAIFEPQWDRGRAPPRSSLRMRDWDVKVFAKEVVPRLVDLDRVLLLSALLRALEDALPVEAADAREVAGVKDDYSYVWASDLADGDHLFEADAVITHLVVGTLDEIASSPDSEDYGPVIEMLQRGTWLIHQRLALYFLARVATNESLRREIVVMLTDSVLVGAYQTAYEYVMLLRVAFPSVTPEDQRAVLASLSSAAAEKGDQAERWLYDRLGAIAGHLTGDWRERFAGYAQEFGEPRDVSPVISVDASWEAIPDRSPLCSDEAGEMTAAQIAEYARQWAIPAGVHPFDRPTWRGLAKEVERLAAQRPAEFSAAALPFAEVNRTVVGGLLDGLKNAVAEDAAIDWPAVLTLITTVAAKDEQRAEGEYRDFDEAPSWSEAKRASSGLLQAGFHGQASPPLDRRSELWEAIESLAANGTVPEHVDLDGVRDPVFYALNSTRSQAVYTAIAYLVWLRRHSDEGVPDNVDEFFRQVLNPEREAFLGMRAAVAHRLPALGYVDQDWVIRLLPAIFPDRTNYSAHWNAAWDAYVRYARPLPNEVLLRAMEEQYATAVQLVAVGPDEIRHNGDPRVELGIHLLLMFLNGMRELEHTNLVAFFEQAPASVRARVVNSVGRRSSEDGLADEWLTRACEFFEWRRRRVEEGELDPTELLELVWFVAAGVFKTEWWAPLLAGILRATANSEDDAYAPPDGMMAQVAVASSTHPAMALEVLEFVLRRNKYGWYEPYLVAADTILSQASLDTTLRAQVGVVADLLAREGHERFERFASPS